PSALGFFGGVFDGKYVYFVPYDNRGPINGGNSGVIERYDTASSFTMPLSWTHDDTSNLPGGNAYGFVGGASAGRYVCLAPHAAKVAARYDTTAAKGLVSPLSWTTFDLTTLLSKTEAGAAMAGASFYGAAFDGRFVYYVPGLGSSVLVRYDTQ